MECFLRIPLMFEFKVFERVLPGRDSHTHTHTHILTHTHTQDTQWLHCCRSTPLLDPVYYYDIVLTMKS